MNENDKWALDFVEALTGIRPDFYNMSKDEKKMFGMALGSIILYSWGRPAEWKPSDWHEPIVIAANCRNKDTEYPITPLSVPYDFLLSKCAQFSKKL